MHPLIDLSKWQGVPDFNVMRSHGVEAVIIRAGNGLAYDPTYNRNCDAARTAGLLIGAYWFCNPKVSTGKTQGVALADASNRHECDLPAMLDVEKYTNEPGPASAAIYGSKYAKWLHEMEFAITDDTGREPLMYTNRAYWDGPIDGKPGNPPHLGDQTFGHLDLICARYPFYSPAQCAAHPVPADAQTWDEWIMAETTARPQVPRGWDDWDAWQFSAGFNGMGPTYGCQSADLDLNIVRDDAWLRWASKPQPSTPGRFTMLANNAETTIANNEHGVPQSYPPHAVKWAILFDPSKPAGLQFTKSHLGPAVYADVQGLPEGALSNAQLVAMPDA